MIFFSKIFRLILDRLYDILEEAVVWVDQCFLPGDVCFGKR